MPSAETRILVVGCGSIGRRHIRLLREMGVEVVGYDPNPESADPVMALGATYTDKWEWVLSQPWGGAIVATPNHLHTEPAVALLSRGCAMLAEKPLAHRLLDAHLIVATAREAGAPLLVGYCLRWHPGLQRVKAMLDSGTIGKPLHANIHFGHYLPDWHPGQDYRQWYSAHRDQGGGVLLDASHELDIANWLFGNATSVMAAITCSSSLQIDTEDLVDMIVHYDTGVQANIHLDYLDRVYERGLSVIGTEGTVKFAMDKEGYTLVVHPHGEAHRISLNVDEVYREELRHFLAVVNGNETPECSGLHGLEVLRVIEAARRSAQEGRTVRFA